MLNKEEIYLNLAELSEEEIREVRLIINSSANSKLFPFLHFNDRYSRWEYFQCNFNPIFEKNKTEVNFQEFKEIMGPTETGTENTQVEIFDIDFGGNCMARMEIQNGKFKFTNAMNGGGYPIAIENIKITPTNKIKQHNGNTERLEGRFKTWQ